MRNVGAKLVHAISVCSDRPNCDVQRLICLIILCQRPEEPSSRMKGEFMRMSLLQMTLALLLGVLATSVQAQDGAAYGAIAFGATSRGEAVVYGAAWNHDSRGAATAVALEACLRKGGKDCREVAWFRNGCGALAVDQDGDAQPETAASREEAEAKALRACEAAGGSGCSIMGSACAQPGGQPDRGSAALDGGALASARKEPRKDEYQLSGYTVSLERLEAVIADKLEEVEKVTVLSVDDEIKGRTFILFDMEITTSGGQKYHFSPCALDVYLKSIFGCQSDKATLDEIEIDFAELAPTGSPKRFRLRK